MRLAAQAKAGFYPAHSLAIERIATHLTCRPPDPDKKFDDINILDPCAGKGVAIRDLGLALGVPEDQIYTVELDAVRSEDCKALMPTHHHIGPAAFAGCQISGGSFGLVYLNPPFDDELGGGRREEMSFSMVAAGKLVPKGILVLVCPYRALKGNRSFIQFLDSFFEDIAVYKFPDGEDEWGQLHRPFNEIVVIGKKRGTPIAGDMVYTHGNLHKMEFHWGGPSISVLPEIGTVQPKLWLGNRPPSELEPTVRTWEIPHSWRPTVFKKVKFTDDELEAVVTASPLGKLLAEVVVPKQASPPLPLDKGHLGLILASGMLDGVVHGPHGPHVVRGSSHKAVYHNKEASASAVNPDTGAVTTKEVISERMVTVIRAVEQDGKIHTFSSDPKPTPGDGEEEGE